MPADPVPPAWHALPHAQALARLQATPAGLSRQEVEARLARHGPNRLPLPPRPGALKKFILQFHNVLIYVLIAAGAVTAVLGHWLDAAVILAVVVINAVIGFVQEGKAERAIDAIRAMLSPRALVLRDGGRREIPAEELVPGDVVLLASGDKVPADLRLVEARTLRVDEAPLTGESVPVEKGLDPVEPEATIGDRTGMAYSGTLVTYGKARGVVVATGAQTELGRISGMLGEVVELATPLTRRMAQFARRLTAVILLGAIAVFAFGVLARDYTTAEMFMAVVGMAVAAIPEGLPALMTIALAIGVRRMAARRAIIRRLPAVETLGSVTVICSDKTGTLTRNEMTVQRVITSGADFDFSGAGYAPYGSLTRDGAPVSAAEHPDLMETARAAVLCNDAVLREVDGRWTLEGDPTEGALLAFAGKTGLDRASELRALPNRDTIPFESEHRFMATLHQDHTGHGFVYLKGAPERVLEMCSHERRDATDRPLDVAAWRGRVDQLAGRGQRVLALAFMAYPEGRHELRFADVEQGLTLLGLVGIMDPPREEAVKAVAQCRDAGIRVKMITGDHVATARVIGAQFGIGIGRTALSGAELENIDDGALRKVVAETDVFARASPEHKLRLVQALQANGEITAMTGDGVNDAPALKRADMGVAMGLKGTEAAKEASDMVIADDNFASIAHAVEEGRTVYDNIRKFVVFVLPTNGGEAGIIIAAILFGMALPITAVQILWVNMITAVTLGLALAFEPAEPGVMRRPPRAPGEPLLSGFLAWRILMVSLLLVVACFGLFLWELALGASVETGRTVAVNMLVAAEVLYLFNSRHVTESVISVEGLTGNRAVLYAVGTLIAFQMLFTYWPVAQRLFGTAAIDADAWLRILLCAAAIFLIVEFEKWLRRRLNWTS
jgi:magnesium-transporting ATPase (P-type)